MHVWKGGVWPSQQAGNTVFFAWRKEDKSFTVRHWVGLTRASCVNLMHNNMILCLMCVSELEIQLYRIHYYEWSSSASSVTIVCLLNDDGRSKWMMQSTIQFNLECSCCWNSDFFQLKTKARSSNGASSCQVDRSQCESIARRDEKMTRRWHRNTSHLIHCSPPLWLGLVQNCFIFLCFIAHSHRCRRRAIDIIVFFQLAHLFMTFVAHHRVVFGPISLARTLENPPGPSSWKCLPMNGKWAEIKLPSRFELTHKTTQNIRRNVKENERNF